MGGSCMAKIKKVRLQVPCSWLEDGTLNDKKFSYLIYLAILKNSKRNQNETERYKYDVTISNIKRATGLDYNTCKNKLNYMIEKGYITIDENNIAYIHRVDTSKYVLLSEEEIELLLGMGSKSEYAIRLYIYLKKLEYPTKMQGTKIKPSQECIANRIGLSPTNRLKIQRITDMLRDNHLIVTKRYWLQDDDKSPKLIMEYILIKSN